MIPATKVVRGFRIAYPASVEAEYTKQLTIFATSIKSLTLKHFNSNSSLLLTVTRFDDIVDDLETITNSLNIAISVETAKVISSLARRFDTAKSFIDSSFKRSLIHLTDFPLVTTPLPAKDMPNISLLKKMWLEKNTQLIKDMPASALIRINDAIYEAVRKGQSMQSLSLKLKDIFAMTKKRARVIARDQIAKLKGDISRYNDLAHGFVMYQWSSCKDGAVRESHQVLEGKVCSWLDASVYKNIGDQKWKKRSSIGGVLKHVGEDIMCRCTNIMLQEVSK